MTPEGLAALIRQRAGGMRRDGRGRFLTAIAGPPGAGKSTLAEAVVAALGSGARVVPMDGFHYDDAVLETRGLRTRKGAPETFDVAGFTHLIHRLCAEDEVAIPVFDRSMELSRAAADVVMVQDRFLLIEGNYLLLKDPPWSVLAGSFGLTVWIDVPEAELDRRLMRRWLHHGKTPQAAREWIDSNDMPNIRRTIETSCPADVTLHWP